MCKSAKILTICDTTPNYGNRLQNYAVQHVLECLGLRVTTISVENKAVSKKDKLKYILQKLSRFHFPGDTEYWRTEFQRKLNFDKFNRKYITTKYVKTVAEIGFADYFVIGSDQVWNPDWYQYCPIKKEAFLLSFARPEQKICFSPSFGTIDIATEWRGWFQSQLKSFPQIAVREEAGAKIIKNLTGKKALVTIDPTLMLNSRTWNSLACKPKHIDFEINYILTYFLGGRSERINLELEEYANETDSVLYHLLDKSHSQLYNTNPSEFIYLISHAKLIITDSFHACIFSFIYGKPFLLYEREGSTKDMMSRMDTLFRKFKLERKYVNSGLYNELLECDYHEGYEALKTEQETLRKFLETSMSKIYLERVYK